MIRASPSSCPVLFFLSTRPLWLSGGGSGEGWILIQGWGMGSGTILSSLSSSGVVNTDVWSVWSITEYFDIPVTMVCSLL